MVASKSNTTEIRNSKADSAFITSGFSNWKKTVEKFKDHERSTTHNNVLLSASRNISIAEQI
jgi:hypothetical protein